ncbi:substrate-binding periplasmic protein [Neptunicella sp. SCSIO 80796]|uniref:substrate-binding periplasmic protein n=1 Tax=Neptunicella plasticusilytica TaxID=3117012 RepID=UPI003A4E12BF
MLKKSFVLLGLCYLPSLICNAQIQVVTEVSPPHQTFEQGRIGGASTELVRTILDQAGIDAEISIYPWARAYHIAVSQPDTLIYNIARTPEREHKFRWICPIASYNFGFIALANADFQIHSLSDAKQHITAVQRGDFSAQWLQQNGFTEMQHLLFTPGIEQSWQLLRNGKVDLIIDDPATIDAMLVKYPDTKVKILYYIDSLRQKTWLAANIDTDQSTLDKLADAFAQVNQTSEYKNLMNSIFN